MNAPVTPDLAGFRAQTAEQGRRVVSVHTPLCAVAVTPAEADTVVGDDDAFSLYHSASTWGMLAGGWLGFIPA